MKLSSLFLIVLFYFFYSHSFGQGRIPLSKNSFKGALEFLPNGKLAEGSNRVSMGPNAKDPLLDPQTWYSEGNESIRGMVGDAVLFLEWWTKSGGPKERYKFDWTSSSYFEVLYPNASGLNTFKRIDRYQLAKYPNLLKRFDNITPIEVDFQFTFHTGDKSDRDYNNFRKKYKIYEDLGSAGYSINYTRTLNGDFILYKASRKKQDWTTPNLTLGGWDEFLNFQDKYNDKRTPLIEIFQLGRTLVISSFRISKIKWRISDFLYIVKKFEDYESGKDKPTALDEVEQGEMKPKAGDDSWNETDIVDTETEAFNDKGKSGIRTKKGKVLQEPIYDQIVKSSKDKYYIAIKGNTVFILNNMGKVVETKNYTSRPTIGTCKDGKLSANIETSSTRVGNYVYFVNTNNIDFFVSGRFSNSQKYYSTYQPLSLSVTSGSDNRTQDQKDADERAWKKDRAQMVESKISSLKSSGYKSWSEVNCL